MARFSRFINPNFRDIHRQLLTQLMEEGDDVLVGFWQSQAVSDRPEMATRELLWPTFIWPMPAGVEALQAATEPNLPWAEEHFQERVGGVALNPPPSHVRWPYAGATANKEFMDHALFSHTYPERMWPKFAGCDCIIADECTHPTGGVRFQYGDLQDVANHLIKQPLSRQAYLPIWFPEDTGVVHGERVPCTLGYHFIIRGGVLHINYMIRSCDIVRHFRDDVYMAVRLAQWMVRRVKAGTGLSTLGLGYLKMDIGSLHCFQGDIDMLWKQIDK